MQGAIYQAVSLLLVQIQRCRPGARDGALFVLVSGGSAPGSPDRLGCRVSIAAAGSWCVGVPMEEVEKEAAKRLAPLALTSPADPEELGDLPDDSRSPRLHLAFQVSDRGQAVRGACLGLERLLLRLSLVLPQVKIHYEWKVDGTEISQVYGGKQKRRALLQGRSLLAESAPYLQCPLPVPMPGPWGAPCGQLHPVAGRAVSLLLPPEVAELGQCGEVALHPVAALCPCLQQYPNRPAGIAAVHLFAHGPHGLPLLASGRERPPDFFRGLARAVRWETYGLEGVQCEDGQLPAGSPWPDAVFTVAGRRSPAARQTLLLFLFVEHADPFQSELGDFVASAETVQQNLDPLLRYNEEAVMSAIHLLLDSALQDWLKAQKAQARLRSALPVILSSVASVVSSSACLDFRTSCFRSMKVRDTQELVASVRQSLVRVTEARFLPSHRSDHRRLPPDVAADAAAPIRGHREERGDEDEDEEEDMDAVLRSRSPEEVVPPGELDSELGGAGRRWGTEARKLRRPGARRKASPPCPAPDQSRPSPSKRRPCPVAPALQEDEVLWLQGISSLPEWE